MTICQFESSYQINYNEHMDKELNQLGLSNKDIAVYSFLIESGPNPVRKIAAATKINRGTTYDILKSVIDKGLVSYYHQAKHKYFVAENPEKLKNLVQEKKEALAKAAKELDQLIPQLQSTYKSTEQKPKVKYYQGANGAKMILGDVLSTLAQAKNKEYYVFSSSDIAKYLYQNFKDFAEQRVKMKIKVKVIAIGPGGKLYGLDQRKWLSRKKSWPTYQIIYGDKLALLSLDQNKQIHGAVIEDKGTAKTQTGIFAYIWKTLK